MMRGLLWLPLLFTFIGLAWAGWNEYQKLDAYQTWAKQFQRAKYDIYAVLGQNGPELTWGKPTRQGPRDLQTVSLQTVDSIQLMVGDRPVDPDAPPTQGRPIVIELCGSDSVLRRIPFTEIALAAQWTKHLQSDWQRFQAEAMNNV